MAQVINWNPLTGKPFQSEEEREAYITEQSQLANENFARIRKEAQERAEARLELEKALKTSLVSQNIIDEEKATQILPAVREEKARKDRESGKGGINSIERGN